MKKLFVSVPMRGRTEEKIKESIEKMHALSEIYFGEKLELIDSYNPDFAPEKGRNRVYCLGQSISKMAEADYFIGVNFCMEFPGCYIESMVARDYDIPRILLELDDCPFLEDAKILSQIHFG